MTSTMTAYELESNIPVASNPDTIDREATRWPFFPGDLITPSAKRHRPDLKHGGELLGQDYKTLVRSKGLLRRCQITPMEIGFDFLNEDLTGGNEGVIVNIITDNTDDNIPVIRKNLNAIRIYPGDEIKGLLRNRHDDSSKGIVELTPLAGVTFEQFQKEGVQEFFFPNWKRVMAGVETLPVQLSGIENILRPRLSDTSDDSIKIMLEEMLESCETYRLWGTDYLKIATALVKTPIHNGFTFTYPAQAEMLFEQLEIRREDLIRPESEIANIISQVNSGNSVSNADMQAVIKLMAENINLLTQRLGQNVPVESVVEDIIEIATESIGERCLEVKANGEPCKGKPLANGFCIAHQPK